ncbi:MAG: hypothetical protein R6X12_06165 [bacterium]
MTTDFVTVWHEDVGGGNTDIWAKFAPDPSARSLFQTPRPSRYPHAEGYWEHLIAEFHCNTLWTEELSPFLPLYEVRFDVRSWVPSFDGRFEPASYYEVQTGNPVPSPYCRSRGGARVHRSYRVDSAASELVYDLLFLDPRRAYDARAVVYHEGKGDWTFELSADTLSLARIKARPGVPETALVRIPGWAYQPRTRAVLSLRRLAADYAPLAGLKLFQVEERTPGVDGPQTAGGVPRATLRLEPCAPNPLRDRTEIRYELPRAGRVSVRVFDAAGR